MKLLTVFPVQWLSPAPRISTPLGRADHGRPRWAVTARSLQGEEHTAGVITLSSSFDFIYKLKHRNLFLTKVIEVGGAGGACVVFRALALGGGLCPAEPCSWTPVAGLAWVKLRGEFGSAVTRLGLMWGSFPVPSLGILCDTGKELKQGMGR